MRSPMRPSYILLSSIFHLATTVAGIGLLYSRDAHHLEKRSPRPYFDSFSKMLNKVRGEVSDQMAVVNIPDLQRQYHEAAHTEQSETELLEEPWWNRHTFEQSQNIVLSALLQETSKLQKNQGKVLHLFSKKLIGLMENNEGQSKSTNTIHDPLRFFIGHQEAPQPPGGFTAVNQAINGIEQAIGTLMDGCSDITHWTPVILRFAVFTLEHDVFRSSEWNSWRDILFGQFISIAYSKEAIQETKTGEKAIQDLLEAEEWCRNSGLKPKLQLNEVWKRLQERLRCIEAINGEK